MIAARIHVAKGILDKAGLGAHHLGDRQIFAFGKELERLPTQGRDTAGSAARGGELRLLHDDGARAGPSAVKLGRRHLSRADPQVLMTRQVAGSLGIQDILIQRDPGERERTVGTGLYFLDDLAARTAQGDGRSRDRLNQIIAHGVADKAIYRGEGRPRGHPTGGNHKQNHHPHPSEVRAWYFWHSNPH